jgi:hypothetical protein
MPIDPALIDHRESSAEVEKRARSHKCQRHPEQRLTVGMAPQGDGTMSSVIQCIQCNLEGQEIQIAPLPNRAAERLGKMVQDREIAIRDGDYRQLAPAGTVLGQEPLGAWG